MDRVIESNETIASNVAEIDNFFVLKAIFYLLPPSQTYFEKTEQVPNLTAEAIKLFFGFIFVEQIIFLLKNGKFNGRMSDIVASTSAGIFSALPNFIFRELNIVAYIWVYDNWKIYELPYNSLWTYIVTLLFVDMMYYWFHRAAHEVNLFWAAHQTHHSSEDYNFSTALRQSMFQKYTSWFFYLPLAMFVRPSIFIVHSHMNLIYQFWLHTEVVDNLGPLEYILNTPSHHRVHHGRNPYCIDKNYAGVLIIFDRMFGTFEKEKTEEKVAYGLVHNIETFDPIYIQVFNYQYLLGRFWSCKTWSERFCVLFKGPGWVPGSPRLGNPGDIPSVELPIKKYHKNVSQFLNAYIGVNFMFVVILFSEFIKDMKGYPTINLSFYIILIIYSLTCFGAFFDKKKHAVYMDLIRTAFFLIMSFSYSETTKKFMFSSDLLAECFKYVNLASFLVMFYLSAKQFRSSLGKKSEMNGVHANGSVTANGKKAN